MNTILTFTTPLSILLVFVLGYIVYRYYIFEYGEYECPTHISNYPYYNKHVPDDLLDVQPIEKKTLVLQYLGGCELSQQFLPIWKQLEDYVETNLLDVVLVKLDMLTVSIMLDTKFKTYPNITLRSKYDNITYDGDYTYEDLAKFIEVHTQ